ncbi:leucine-rich repeat domain-containing protein [candidate division KSB1 bacterium]|nr:leucine-rich repeat domain-containing protein [candidate division KSB1 bacterium]
MDKRNLFDQLLSLYTQANLNHIASWIISAFKLKNHKVLLDLVKRIPEVPFASEKNISKLFTQLMILYHPDKLLSILKKIEDAYKDGPIETLKHFLHISSTLAFIEKTAAQPSEDQNIQSSNQRADCSPATPTRMDTNDGSFISALKQKEYGNLDVVYHDGDLINMEGDLELSGYQIQNLSGLELCQNLIELDLSHNTIYDIWALSQLYLIEELNLSSNRIGSIDALESLSHLRILDLSFNDIEDIESLYDLEKLEVVNLIGNPIKEEQLPPLRRRGVVVII